MIRSLSSCMNLFFESLNLLRAHSEFDMAFLYGHRLDEIPLLKRDAKIWKCLVAIPFFIFTVLKKTTFRTINADAEALFFAETLNQYNALDFCFKELKNLGTASHLLVADKDLRNSRYQEAELITYSLPVTLVALLLMIVRLPYATLYCLSNPRSVLRLSYLHKVIGCYVYVPYFLDYLRRNKPQGVIVSNDHNPICRSLQFAAKSLGIKSFYLQHSSVSPLFPRLICDWALLDGRDSLEKYTSLLPYGDNDEAPGDTKVVLSGLKKHIAVARESKQERQAVGVAFNKLDSLERLTEVVKTLDEESLECIIRLHPGIEKVSADSIRARFFSYGQTFVESAKDIELDDFLGRIDFMIAGESGIHLEALLAGVQSYYFLLDDKNTTFDYYGFIRSGLISELKEVKGISKDQISALKNISNSQKLAIRHYSETYGTSWMGQEGKLAALTIERVLKNAPLELFDEVTQSSSNMRVFELARATR